MVILLNMICSLAYETDFDMLYGSFSDVWISKSAWESKMTMSLIDIGRFQMEKDNI